MELKLLKDLGDHKKGEVLEIKDQSVADKWLELGIAEKPKQEKEEKPKQEKEEKPKQEKEEKPKQEKEENLQKSNQ